MGAYTVLGRESRKEDTTWKTICYEPCGSVKCVELYDQLRFKKLLRSIAMFVLVLFAAQDHPGGRISSLLHNGSWIETGAQWIHGQNNEVWKLADRYDLLSRVTSSEGEGKILTCSHALSNDRDKF